MVLCGPFSTTTIRKSDSEDRSKETRQLEQHLSDVAELECRSQPIGQSYAHGPRANDNRSDNENQEG